MSRPPKEWLPSPEERERSQARKATFSKGRYMSVDVSGDVEDDGVSDPPVAEETHPATTDETQATWSKYDQRASGAGTTHEEFEEEETSERVIVDLTSVEDPVVVDRGPQSFYERQLDEAVEASQIREEQAAVAEEDKLTYFQRRTANLPHIEDQD